MKMDICSQLEMLNASLDSSTTIYRARRSEAADANLLHSLESLAYLQIALAMQQLPHFAVDTVLAFRDGANVDAMLLAYLVAGENAADVRQVAKWFERRKLI